MALRLSRDRFGRVGWRNSDYVRQETIKRRRELLAAARVVIRSRYPDPDLSVADVAWEINSSPRQVQRVFREQAGEDFRGYLLRIRMEQATKLLTRKHNLPVRAVAPRVGYRQASGLRQAFVRYYGYNPSEIQPDPPAYIGDVIPGPTAALDRPVERRR